MNRSAAYKHWIVAGVSLMILVIMVLSGNKYTFATSVKQTYIDTPTKKYFLKIDSLPIDEWKSVTDTLAGIFGTIGKSLSVDQAAMYQTIALRQLQTIGKRISLDSTHIKPKK